jgi:hypothetical protein
MSEVAQPTNNVPALLNPIVYFRISAIALGAVALLGFVMNLIDGSNVSTSLGANNTFLNFTYAHDAVHLVLALAAALFGFGSLAPNVVRTFAIIFGIVYAGLGVVGFFAMKGADGDTFLALTPGLNAVHLLLGAYALTSGLVTKFD